MSQAEIPSREVPSPFSRSNAVPDRLVHLIPDELASQVPEHVLFAYPKAESVQDGFVDVTARQFAQAINRTSWYLESSLGKAAPGTFPSVAYMGSNDLRYFLLVFGAIKAGYKMLFLSPRNSVAGHVNVLEKANCNVFLVSQTTQIDHILSQKAMDKTLVIPELEYFLQDEAVEPYPYNKSYAEARSDPCLVLHTTGSTGLPKPITWKLEILSTYEAWRTIPAIDGYVPTTEVYQEASRVYNAMPLFHTSGINIGITMALVLGVTTVLGAADVLPNAAYADEMHKYAGVDGSIGAPSIFEDLSIDAGSLDRMSQLRYVLVCGAPLSQSVGDSLSEKTRVISNFGATETACLPRLAPGREDWAYFYWHPSHSGIELREYFEGLYELFLVKKPELREYQGIFSTFPEIEEYSMNDLYARHPDPEKPFLYRWQGRSDDVIVLSNGEKIAPALMEAGLRSSPLVKAAMVVGHGKFEPAALVDLGRPAPETTEDRATLMKELQVAIGEANKHAPAHGKLDRYHILLVDQARPMRYLGQGKIQRKQTYDLYKEDIDRLYQEVEDPAPMGLLLHHNKVDFNDRSAIVEWLRELLVDIANINELESEEGLFAAGLDSLHVIRLVREFKIQVKLAEDTHLKLDNVAASVVYQHSTLETLADFFYEGHLGKRAFEDVSSDDEGSAVDRLESMESMLGKYVQKLPVKTRVTDSPPLVQRKTVLLTGSTGSLGSYLLHELMQDPTVEHIVCLDRSSGGAEKYQNSRGKRGLGQLNLSGVEFFKANLSHPQLGLTHEAYERLERTVTHIVHCQWPVNFNWSFASFEPYIAGVVNLIHLAHSSARRAFILFVSSVAAVGGWGTISTSEAVPEAPIHDLNAAAGTGYGQSKLLAECLLDRAAAISGVRSASCRVGIVAGPVERGELGLWSTHEYIPSIIVSSAHLGVFPSTFPSRDRVDWLPVDKLARILIEIMAFGSKPPSPTLAFSSAGMPRSYTYHVVNPRASSWSRDIASTLLDAYPNRDLQAVSFDEWVEHLRASADETDKDGNVDVQRNPAIRLIDFYSSSAGKTDKGRSNLALSASEAASETLRGLGPVSRDWLGNWMAQWGILKTTV